eukprot:Gregarina_sp_Poly_1__795@NODE_118_length_13642_cov_140_527956_g105_i0_p4_GENE_NODE_118_length_13642_cov_140_527956_g105_i0NODE_118_length_13642_cov_140_527956_g105_i0_p4_ORF_typecomplete_len398_score37_42_NODE_118_length_13642_cov_140_527956_g105_i069148107
MSGRHLGKLIHSWSQSEEESSLPHGAILGVAVHVAGNPITMDAESLPADSNYRSSLGSSLGSLLKPSKLTGNGVYHEAFGIIEGVPLKGKVSSLIVHPTPKDLAAEARDSSKSSSVPKSIQQRSNALFDRVDPSSQTPLSPQARPPTTTPQPRLQTQSPSVASITTAQQSKPPKASVRRFVADQGSEPCTSKFFPLSFSKPSLQEPAPANANQTSVRHSMFAASPGKEDAPPTGPGNKLALPKARSMESISSNKGDTIFHFIENDPPVPRRRSYASVVRGQLANVQTQAITLGPRISFGVPAMRISQRTYYRTAAPLEPPVALLTAGLRWPTTTIRTRGGLNSVSSLGLGSLLPAETMIPGEDLMATGLVMRNGVPYKFVTRKKDGRTEVVLKPARS